MLQLVDMPLLMLALAVVAIDGGAAVGAVAAVHVVIDTPPFPAVVDHFPLHYRLARMTIDATITASRMTRHQNVWSRTSRLTTFTARPHRP